MEQKNLTRILIAVDTLPYYSFLSYIFINEPYEIDFATGGDDCLMKVTIKHYDVIFLDLKMPNKDGMEYFELLSTLSTKSVIVMITDIQEPNLEALCFKNGVIDYWKESYSLSANINGILQAINVEEQPKHINWRTPQYQIISGIPQIIGASKAIQKLRIDIESVALYDKESVLITGSDGSGKEFVAEWVHSLSPRRLKPIIKVNCAATSSDLLEIALAGYTRGSFAGARKDTKGLFEAADGGILFLDEIGEMSDHLQSVLLRFIKTSVISPIGSVHEIPVNVRIVATTNKDLHDAAEKREFRLDLLYILENLTIKVPSLTERKEDIPLLVEHFKDVFFKNYQNVEPKSISPDALDTLRNINWTGVRQLRNVITKLLVHTNKQIVDEDDVKKMF